jgi:6-phosphogluconolactonase (cycloisomerase 2 family)
MLFLGVVAMAAQPAEAKRKHPKRDNDAAVGRVFTLTNGTQDPATDRNQVIEFDRTPSGALQQAGTFDTGGLGGQEEEHGCALPPSGAFPGRCPFIDAQNEVILSRDNHLLFAVNPGSSTISSFAVSRHGLTLVDQQPSGGQWPTSLTAHGDLLYVLNSNSLSIAGFRVGHDGRMTPIPHSIQPLSAGATSADVPPKQIQFDTTGRVLAVTLLAIPVIDTFRVDQNGGAGPAQANSTASPFPFAFSVTPRNQLVVAEIVDPNNNTPVSNASSYQLDAGDAQLSHIQTLPTGGFAACWTAITHNGRYVYIVNTGGGSPSGATVSAYRVAPDGSLALLQVTPPGAPGVAPGGEEFARTDDVVSGDDRYLYVLVPGVLGNLVPSPFGFSRIDIFAVGPHGRVTQVGSTSTNLPPGVSGLASS